MSDRSDAFVWSQRKDFHMSRSELIPKEGESRDSFIRRASRADDEFPELIVAERIELGAAIYDDVERRK